MQMLKKCEFVLRNLRIEDVEELYALWGENWEEKIISSIKELKVNFAFGKDENGNIVPIAMGGFQKISEENPKIACAWLLATKYIKNNKLAFMRVLRAHIIASEKEYQILYNYIYKSNKQSKEWLLKLGFCFDNPKPNGLNVQEGFEFFYKINNRKEL